MKFLIAATFKSHKTSQEVKDWLDQVAPVTAKSPDEIVVAPSFPYFSIFHHPLSNLSLAAQDVSPFPPGSYTGAVNAEQLKDCGVTYCIVGHSERRRYFHETHADVANKIFELRKVGITPILCLAENDIFPQLAAIDNELKDQIVYCFEPPADIGGSETADLHDIKRVIDLIRKSVAGKVKAMYGGSVNAHNIKELCQSTNIDGVLVSTACLEAESFISIINVHEALAK